MMHFNHAIVLGGGFSGMLSSYVFSHYFDQVTLIEKYALSADTIMNRIPQANHLHVLMKHGQDLLEQLMPGILSDLAKHSLEEIDWSADTRWYGPFGPYPQYESDIKTLSFSRICLDQCMRERILALKNVNVLKAEVIDITCAVKKANVLRIDTVQYMDAANKPTFVTANLIVDARGRRSNASEWLKRLGFQVLAPRIVQNELGYASRIYKILTNHPYPFKQIYLQTRPGRITKGAVISPIEHQHMIVTALGLGKDKPIRDEDAFHHFLTQLPGEEIKHLLKKLKPVSSIHTYRNLKNCHYRFGKMKRWPAGFIVIGDAACLLNPVYGQGMTLVTKQILTLQSTLVRLQKEKQKPNLNWEHAFQKKIDQITFLPWLMATTEDQRNLATALPFYLRALHYYFDFILKHAVSHHKTHHIFLRMLHMVKSPYHLFNPLLLLHLIFN